jgi:hypothetical protein
VIDKLSQPGLNSIPAHPLSTGSTFPICHDEQELLLWVSSWLEAGDQTKASTPWQRLLLFPICSPSVWTVLVRNSRHQCWGPGGGGSVENQRKWSSVSLSAGALPLWLLEPACEVGSRAKPKIKPGKGLCTLDNIFRITWNIWKMLPFKRHLIEYLCKP